MRVRDFVGGRVEDLTSTEEEDDDIGVLTTNATSPEVTAPGLGLCALMFVVSLHNSNRLISVISGACFSSVIDSSLTRFRVSRISVHVPVSSFLCASGRFSNGGAAQVITFAVKGQF